MRDPQGRSWLQRHREERFDQSFMDDMNEELKHAIQNPKDIARLRQFTSQRSLIKSILPQVLIGIFIGYIEYFIVGILYTVISIIVLFPILYAHSVSLRTRDGTFIMYPTDDFLDWEKMFVPTPIWNLVQKKTGLTLENGKINGRATFLCTKVEFLPDSNIPFFVEIAWAHSNRLKYALFSSIMDDLTAMLKDTLLEVAKLKQVGKVEAIVEATKQSKDTIDAITSAYYDDMMTVLKKQKITEEEADLYEREVKELLQNPEYIRALMKKKGEEQRQETS